MLHIVLVEPEIPQNKGNIARTVAATGCRLHLVRPLGFSTDDRYLKRAGLDYWPLVPVSYWDSFPELQAAFPERTFYYATTKGRRKYTDVTYGDGDFLVFGKETAGLPPELIAARHGLKIVEDACEALGSEYAGVKAGTAADGAVFAFYPNKQITTAEGGMIVTNDAALAELCRSLRSQGRGADGSWLYHERMGYNYRLSELHAALGLTQLRRIDAIVARRERIAESYAGYLRGIPGVTLPQAAPEVTRMSWFVYVIRLDEGINRDRVMEYLRAAGVECKPYFTPIHLQPYLRREYGFRAGDFPRAEAAGRACLALPFFNTLTETEMEYVAEKLSEAVAVATV